MQYVLKPATGDSLGGIKVGDDFTVETDGTLNIKNMEQMKEQLAELPEMVANGKAELAIAISERNVPTDPMDTFHTMAENVGKISGGVSYEAIPVQNIVKDYTLIEN